MTTAEVLQSGLPAMALQLAPFVADGVRRRAAAARKERKRLGRAGCAGVGRGRGSRRHGRGGGAVVDGASLIHPTRWGRGGSEVDNEETGAKQVFGTGEFILESVGQWHQGINPGTDELRLLVIDLTQKGMDNTILR